MSVTCPKCGSSKITLTQDKRGLAQAHCADCGAFIKKLTCGETVEYYETLFATLKDKESEKHELDTAATPPKMPCKYCQERYVMVQGSRQTRIIQVPIDNEYCPICGRKLTKADKMYQKRI